jgi:cell fate (sporulation/competence/biofilm development) regulator YlbF (YheA/YmcA/DUF963 family)
MYHYTNYLDTHYEETKETKETKEKKVDNTKINELIDKVIELEQGISNVSNLINKYLEKDLEKVD